MAKPSREALAKAGGRTKDGRTLPPASIWIIGVDTTHGPEHPLYSDDAVQLARSGRYEPYAAMMRNIRALGVIEPLRVRYERVADDDVRWPEEARGQKVHVAVTGRHRTLLARRVAAELWQEGVITDLRQWQIDVVLDEATEVSQIDKVISENFFRRRPSPIEIGHQVAQALDKGFTMDGLCERFGYGESQLRNFQALATQGTEALHAALRSGWCSATKACQLAKLPAEQQRQAVSELQTAPTPTSSMQVRPPGRKLVKAAAERARDGELWTPREKEILAIVAGELPLDQAKWPELKELFRGRR